MKIFVMVDMEGGSGICQRSQTVPGELHYQTGRKYMTDDVNACVDGCFAGGASRVVVRDTHSKGFNFIWESLDPRAEYIQGASRLARMPGIDGFDGMILLGYHTMAGTPEAILEHTMSPKVWQNFWINGRKCGEMAVEAGVAGDHNVPTIMVSGCDKTCSEARRFFKNLVTVEVKRSLDVEGGILLPREKAHELIRAGAAKAVQNCHRVKPFRFKRPVTMRLELVSRERVPVTSPHVRVIDGRTYEVKGTSVEEALNRL